MPVQLPDVLVILLGALSPMLVQLVKKAFHERIVRFLIALFLTAVTGTAAFFIVKPPSLDLADTIAWVFAASQLSYQFFKSIWDKAAKKN